MNLVLHSDGARTAVHPKDFKKFTLEELQTLVGGYIETVRLTSDRVLIINENGKYENLPFNESATALAHACNAIFPSDFIVGDAVLIYSSMLD